MPIKRFDYEKDGLNEYVFHGFHKKNGINHIDTKRLVKLGLKDKFPKELFTKPRNTHYFIPNTKRFLDYAVNNLIRVLDILQNDWNKEYKEAISKIKTPNQVEGEVLLDRVCRTCSGDDYEDAQAEATIAKAIRSVKYDEVIRSIGLQYLQKIFIEYSRALFLVFKSRKLEENRFTNSIFRNYVLKRLKLPEGKKPLLELPHYRYYDLLRCMDNFLKHNSLDAYNHLTKSDDSYLDKEHKEFLLSYVDTKRYKYKSGMYSGNWLKIDETFVDEIINNLREFSKELCKLLYKEDAEEARWNSDEYLRYCLTKALSEEQESV